MTNVIVPLNVAALRVSQLDNNSVVGQFKGRTALFDELPYGDTTSASTGDTISQSVQQDLPPVPPLSTGVHLHWQLPDFFRNGAQRADGAVVFPPAPNRWLVVRSLSVWNTGTGTYGTPALKIFVVESDYIGATKWVDSYGMTHASVPVPLPANPQPGDAPFRYMGRTLDYESWQPSSEQPSEFLPSYAGVDGKPLQLNSMGFVGPSFSSYYPECSTVFGFWDHFMDLPEVGPAVSGGTPVRFKVSYQLLGWVNAPVPDPVAGLAASVSAAYQSYVAKCAAEGVAVDRTPASMLQSRLTQEFGWSVPGLDPQANLGSLPMPSATLLNGLLQEILWDQLENPGTTTFLSTATGGAVWQSTAEVAVGNTTIEALSALLSSDMGTPPNPDVLGGYEYLLNALQTGLLSEMEAQPSKLIYLDESLHAKGFAADFGGWEWLLLQPASAPGVAPKPSRLEELPSSLAAMLATLNAAQKSYDQGRLGLTTRRRQLFMDWYRYVKLLDNQASPDPNVPLNTLESFLQSSGACELNAVAQAGTATGLLLFTFDPDSGDVTSMQLAPGSAGLAAQTATAYSTLLTALRSYPGWSLKAHASAKFYQPTDPVLVAEGPALVPAHRNGKAAVLPVRLSPQLLSELQITANDSKFTVQVADLASMPSISVATPSAADVAALVAESFLLIPMLGSSVASALVAQGGAGNPATGNAAAFITALNTAQGGLSPLEGGPGAGLFAAIQAPDYVAVANPTQSVTTPLTVSFAWTNAAANGWMMNTVGWNAQRSYTELAPGRTDPFLPLYFTWQVRLAPLLRGRGDHYTGTNLTQYFNFDTDAVDYTYAVQNGTPPVFTEGTTVDYVGAVVLSSRAAYSLAAQITAYLEQFPSDPAKGELTAVRDAYLARNFISQALDGFNAGQLLTQTIPQIRVENLSAMSARDAITRAVQALATSDSNDDWYDASFNNMAPVYQGLQALDNFGPLRSGFLEVRALEVVDVFGQRMSLSTAQMAADGALQPVVAMSLAPPAADTVNAGKVFLPPRVLWPTRLWLRYLAAEDLPGAGLLAETNTHAASTPIFGWVVPNHLDRSLFFYNADGSAIGSFAKRASKLVYRTRPANLGSPDSTLSEDLVGANTHLATLMEFVAKQSGSFLSDLMSSIQASEPLIQPAGSAQSQALAVLIGRPLALTRCVLGLETSGGLLPLSQADTAPTDAFPSDVLNGRFLYEERQQFSSASLAAVQLPVRMGNLANTDDGLVCFLPESSDPSAVYSTVYAATAPAAGGNGVEQPTATTTQLTANGGFAVMTLLADPRARVHATTGVLPVMNLDLDPNQYQAALQNIAVTFFTAPVLSGANSFAVPLPAENGYQWNWITTGTKTPQALPPNAVDGTAVFGYSPQTLVEGWLDLEPITPTQAEVAKGAKGEGSR